MYNRSIVMMLCSLVYEPFGENIIIANVTFEVRPDAPVDSSNIGLYFTNIPDGTPGNTNGDILWDNA